MLSIFSFAELDTRVLSRYGLMAARLVTAALRKGPKRIFDLLSVPLSDPVRILYCRSTPAVCVLSVNVVHSDTRDLAECHEGFIQIYINYVF
jgi:hypothetical protein